jgi:hypothetical protein
MGSVLGETAKCRSFTHVRQECKKRAKYISMLGCEIEIENFNNNNNNNKASVTIRLGKSSRASRMIKIWQSNKTHEGTQSTSSQKSGFYRVKRMNPIRVQGNILEFRFK